ncbi:hypothetical protein KIW84_057928 [Lathyrus oleraceus]|uniref:Uncharacterized protein n=1 Tax=Pisum sativum TaxID=3888 RepID=A0A9D4X4N3_PEA|nr:hypothetical protein KIW84_057928 [Pisum sativum]
MDVIFTENELQREQENDSTSKDITTFHIDGKSVEDYSFEAEPEHEVQELEEPDGVEVRRPTRQKRKPNWQSDYVMESHDAYYLLTEDGEGSTFQEANYLLLISSQNNISFAIYANPTEAYVDGELIIGVLWFSSFSKVTYSP